MSNTKTKDTKLTEFTKADQSLFKEAPKFDINAMYERVFEELMLQQSKRDQLITIYLAAFAFIVPSLLTAQSISWTVNGIIFTGLGVIGFLFALIIVRYRKYKEVYWICCRTLTVMMDMDEDNWTKDNIQRVFFNCQLKKVKKYIKNSKFQTFKFVRKNLFSGETLYLVIHAIIAGSVLGLGVGILVPLGMQLKLLIGAAAGLALLILAMWIYFGTLVKTYRDCVDRCDDSFNYTYNDAWFLHFFVM